MKLNIKNTLRALVLTPVLAFAVSAVVAPMTTNVAQAAPTNYSPAGGASDARDPKTLKITNVDGSTGIFQRVVNILLYIIGAVAVIMIVFGGIRYVISGGDSAQVTAAKNTILYAVVGLVVALLAYAIINFVIGGING